MTFWDETLVFLDIVTFWDETLVFLDIVTFWDETLMFLDTVTFWDETLVFLDIMTFSGETSVLLQNVKHQLHSGMASTARRTETSSWIFLRCISYNHTDVVDFFNWIFHLRIFFPGKIFPHLHWELDPQNIRYWI